MPTPPYRILFPEKWTEESSQQQQPTTIHTSDFRALENMNSSFPRTPESTFQPHPASEPTFESHSGSAIIPDSASAVQSQSRASKPEPVLNQADNAFSQPMPLPWAIPTVGMQPTAFPDTTPILSDGFETATQRQLYSPSFAAQPVTRAEIEAILDQKLASLRVYVLESDITEAQRAVKSVVELASF